MKQLAAGPHEIAALAAVRVRPQAAQVVIDASEKYLEILKAAIERYYLDEGRR